MLFFPRAKVRDSDYSLRRGLGAARPNGRKGRDTKVHGDKGRGTTLRLTLLVSFLFVSSSECILNLFQFPEVGELLGHPNCSKPNCRSGLFPLPSVNKVVERCGTRDARQSSRHY
jgi:hypothetical protein